MNKVHKLNLYFFSFIISIVFISKTNAQPINDAGLWATCNISKKINKKFSVFLTEEYRMRENFSQINLFYTDLGVAVKPYDFLKISLAWRSIEKFITEEPISFRHRLQLDITAKRKFGKFSASFRERLQAEVRNIYTSDNGHLPEWYSRNKIEIKYDLDKPITPYVAVEFRYQISNPRQQEVDHYWHRNRYYVGIDYKRNDRHSFGLYYMIQNEFNVSSPQNNYIVGVEYSLDL